MFKFVLLTSLLLSFSLFLKECGSTDIMSDFSYAASEESLITMRVLLALGEDINQQDIADGDTPLISAVTYGKIKAVKLLLDKGAKVNMKNNDGDTAISSLGFLSGGKHEAEIIQLLVDKGADVNSKDKGGDTALHSAAMFGKVNIVEALLKNGAKADLKNKNGDMPISSIWTIDNEDNAIKILHLLVSHGVKINERDGGGNTVLHSAVMFGKVDLVEDLLKNGAEANLKNNDGDMPIFSICTVDNEDNAIKILDLLISHGVNINEHDGKGDTLSEYGMCIEKKSLFKRLKELGLKLEG